MDDARFDRLTAALAAASSRRGLLLSCTAGLLAVLGRARQDATAKKKRRKCKGDQKKCGKRCIPKTGCCTSRNCPQGDFCRNGRCSNCVTADDCTPPSGCRQAACEEGRCVFDPIPGDGGTVACGVGACERTAPRCVAGEEQQCVPGQPSTEVCNGIDDDCDGVIDNGACPVDAPSSCGSNGVCTGGVCQKYGPETVCQPASCIDTTLQPAARCDGDGNCMAPPTQSCAPYKCHSTVTACVGSCGGEVDCVSDHFCFGGQCIPKRDNGEDCQRPVDCASNFCDNGRCQPKRANGETCAFAEQCASGICVANVCCATFCNAGQLCTGGTCQG